MSSLRGKAVLVTGGAGFIGSNLVERIQDDGPRKVIVADNFFLGSLSNLSALKKIAGVEIVRIDCSDFASFLALCEKEEIESIFNLAVVPLPTSILFPSMTLMTNISITTNCVEVARRKPEIRIIHLSSSEVYGSASYTPMDESHPSNKATPYAASKVASDHVVLSYVETFGIDAMILRPFNNFGPRQNSGSYAGIIPILVDRIRQHQPVRIYGDGEQTRDFVFVRDTVDLIVLLSNKTGLGGSITNIASGIEVSINSLVARVLKVMDAENHPVEHLDARPGDVRKHLGDTSRISKILGTVPAGMTEDNLKETIAWYTNKPGGSID